MQQQASRQSNSSREISPSSSPGTMTTMGLNAPRFGTTVPNRIFVGGITTDTTEPELLMLFSTFGKVKAVKIINDRAGVPRGYGFITFETDEEAKRVLREGDNLVLKGRKLNVAIAIKKQQVGRSAIESAHYIPNGTIMYHPHNGLGFPTYPLNEPTHFYSPEALYQFAAAAAATGGAGPGPGISQGTGSGATTYPLFYQHQPFAYVAQPQAPQTPSNLYPNHFHPHPHLQPQPNAAAHWPGAHFLLPQVMVNSHVSHVS